MAGTVRLVGVGVGRGVAALAAGGAPASRVILHARKGSRGGLRLLQGLILHEADGRYTAKAEAVLRQGEALELGD